MSSISDSSPPPFSRRIAPSFLLVLLCWSFVQPAFCEEPAAETEEAFARDADASAYAALKEVRLDWTAAPGAFERDLQRRHRNPLFPADRQLVSESELRSAKIRDAEDGWRLLDEFISIQSDRRTLAHLETVEEIDTALTQMESFIRKAMSVGGQGPRLADSMRQTRLALVKEWRSARGEDREIAARLAGIETSGEFDQPASVDEFVAQVKREDGPILDEELAAATLSEQPDSIALLVRSLNPSQRYAVKKEALELLVTVDALGVEIDNVKAKRSALFSADR